MAEPNETSRRRILDRADVLLGRADEIVYVVVAGLFLLAACGMAAYSVITLAQHVGTEFPTRLVEFINGLLLVLIIMEVLGTVRSYLATGHTSLRPFLYIGIISATRRILAIGAATTLGEVTGESAFRHEMIDLGINAAVVLALATALYLFSRQQAQPDLADESPRHQ